MMPRRLRCVPRTPASLPVRARLHTHPTAEAHARTHTDQRRCHDAQLNTHAQTRAGDMQAKLHGYNVALLKLRSLAAWTDAVRTMVRAQTSSIISTRSDEENEDLACVCSSALINSRLQLLP
jgi:hypothetical protein